MSDNDTGSRVATKEKPSADPDIERADTESAPEDTAAADAVAEVAAAEGKSAGDKVALDKPAGEKVSAEQATAEKSAAASDAEADPATPGRWSRIAGPARRASLPVAALVAVLALVAAGVLGWQLKQERDIDAAGEAGLAAARSYGVILTSVDATKLDSDFAAVLDGSTGEFRDMYTRSSGQLRQLLLDNKATGKGTVLDAAIKSATKTKVEVLLFIDQTVTNSASADPRVDRSRVAMTMELVDGRWLASRVYLP
ncbi:hypothetical protein [Nocardia sp. NPDC005366]|uniref:hypothetical protein n=1 Tax=Nocardia sp. NPDC005366 TaxID=3156878 RepID=UPI0033B02A8D